MGTSTKQRRQKPDPSPTQQPFPPRLPTETSKSYTAFCAYLETPVHQRSLRALASTLKTQPSVTGQWSQKNQWQARTLAWDEAQRRERLAAIQARQLERDLATMEHEDLLAASAGAALFSDVEPTTPGIVRDLYRIAKSSNNDFARIKAIMTLVDLAGIKDLRKIRYHRAIAPTPSQQPASSLDLAALVEALAKVATPTQLEALCGGSLVDDPPEPEPPINA